MKIHFDPIVLYSVLLSSDLNPKSLSKSDLLNVIEIFSFHHLSRDMSQNLSYVRPQLCASDAFSFRAGNEADSSNVRRWTAVLMKCKQSRCK